MPSRKFERRHSKERDRALVAAVRQHMVDHSGVPLTVEQYAKKLDVTVRQLSAAFQRSMGVSVAMYVRGERIRIAQRLLLQTSQPIQEISAELGFSNSANFSSAFREFTGMTPSQFRKTAPLDQMLITSSDIKWGQGPV